VIGAEGSREGGRQIPAVACGGWQRRDPGETIQTSRSASSKRVETDDHTHTVRVGESVCRLQQNAEIVKHSSDNSSEQRKFESWLDSEFNHLPKQNGSVFA
jgi:hypothetical protein